MVTQKDIARKLGVSPSLVSRALAGTAQEIGASMATVEKIRNEAKRLKYAPNAAALTLRGSSSMTIGVVVKDFDDPFLGRMIGELQELAQANGFSLLLAGCDTKKRHRVDSSSLLRYQLDGLILCGSDICAPWLTPFLEKGLRIVQIGSDAPYAGVSRVSVDERCGIELLLGHLLSLGHTKIGFIGDNGGPHRRRLGIFKAMLDERGLPSDNVSMARVAAGTDAGAKAMKSLLKGREGKGVTAVVAADDTTAQGGFRAAHELGVPVPDGLSLAGIDDIPSASLMVPSLTTIKAPLAAIVQTAFEIMAGRREGGAAPVLLKPEIIVRESTSRLQSH